ncbi:hypothetical protein DOTSEDRAFT_29963 [Dothistroma septosporum NZE10]|uniref:Uncharacterized protein n=1 Tax=Dothistroma septosporum (strain NZE10 / CBS 128990) TaxID=675120 RepID=N1Q1K7_DOTSN|nr:hypothetical protein DOTSEDRAFT_29963 [Dothistroma septosporum NZE10]
MLAPQDCQRPPMFQTSSAIPVTFPLINLAFCVYSNIAPHHRNVRLISSTIIFKRRKQQEVSSHRASLADRVKQIDGIISDRAASIRAQKRLLERLYTGSKGFIDASEDTGTISRLEGRYQLCHRLTAVAATDSILEEVTREKRSLQQECFDAGHAFRAVAGNTSTHERATLRQRWQEAKDRWHNAACHSDIQKKHQ